MTSDLRTEWRQTDTEDGVTIATRHALFWMMSANIVGLGLSLLLVAPGIGSLLGTLSYGRWVPVHLNLHLYGWTSLPLVAWLLTLYRAGERARIATWAWSMAMIVGVASWLTGHTSGKIFLDWTSLSLVLFPLTLCLLWTILATGFWQHRRDCKKIVTARAAGLLLLAAVPVVLFWASGRDVYPAVNPETGGPTGVDLLASTLSVVFLMLLVPIVQGITAQGHRRWLARCCWCVFVSQICLVAIIGTDHASHRDWPQWLSLGTLTSWIVLMPLYYSEFGWPAPSRRWRLATLSWFGVLTATGWFSFLPKILDHLKFTDGLVAHSHLAMAGFVTSFNLFLVSLLGKASLLRVINRPIPFWLWTGATAAYVILMWIAGTCEGYNPSFTVVPGLARNLLYIGRLIAGAVLLVVSILWWESTLERT